MRRERRKFSPALEVVGEKKLTKKKGVGDFISEETGDNSLNAFFWSYPTSPILSAQVTPNSTVRLSLFLSPLGPNAGPAKRKRGLCPLLSRLCPLVACCPRV